MAEMKLYYSPGSPYARKVRVMAMETSTTLADLLTPLLVANPFGNAGTAALVARR